MREDFSILIVDDDERMVNTLVDVLRVRGYQAVAAYSGPEALENLKTNSYACVLTDIKMPQMHGVELYQAIRDLQPNLPVILMTAFAKDKLVQEGLDEGVVAVLNKPLDINLLLNFFASLRSDRPILVVDDDPRFAEVLGKVLRKRGYAVTEVVKPEDIESAINDDVEMVLLDTKLSEGGDLDVFKHIREQHPYLPIILITSRQEEISSALEAAGEISAYTCLYKPLQVEGLFQVVDEVHHMELGRLLGRPARKRGEESDE